MVVAIEKSTRIVVKSEIADDWEAMRTRTGLSQQEVFDRLVRFLFEQDELAQAMILRTIQPRADLVELTLRRLAQSTSPANGSDPNPGKSIIRLPDGRIVERSAESASPPARNAKPTTRRSSPST